VEINRIQLASSNTTRNSTRTKGQWGVNILVDGPRVKKRFGLIDHTSGTSPGQGLLMYGTVAVSIRNDTLYVGASSFAL